MTFRNTISFLVAFVACLSPCHTFFDVYMYKCSSAMVCVDISKCDKVGIISTNDVILTENEELFRSPLVPCRKPDGDQGVCCRDPNYKDDWPTDYVDNKGKWNPKPTQPQILASGSKTTEVKVCTPPEVKLPNGRCGKADVVSSGSSFSSEQVVKVPTKAPLEYLPPVTELPCPPGTQRGPKPGSCVSQSKNVPPTVAPTPKPSTSKEFVSIPTTAPSIYLPPVTELPCPAGTQRGPKPGSCEAVHKDVPVVVPTPKPSTARTFVEETTKAPVVYLPPKSSSNVKEEAECGPNETRLGNGECMVVPATKPPVTYVPPVPKTPSKPCPPGTNRTPKGCEATITIYKPHLEKKTPSTAKPPITAKPTLPYMPDRTYLPPVPRTQLKPAETNVNSIFGNNEGQCSHGSIMEHNNKRYCCELIS